MKFGATAREVGPVADMISSVQTAESVGFDGCWVSEHHDQPAVGTQYWPATLLRIGSIARLTKDIEFLTSALVLPLHNPLEVAEKVAVLDQLTDGRITLGVGMGYVEKEFDAFGMSMDERAGRFVEGIQILDRYLSSEEPFSFDGEIWSIEDWQPTPTTAQEPRPPILVGGWGEMALKRSIRLGDGWIAGLTADVDALTERRRTLKFYADEYGESPEDLSMPVMRETVVAETREEALELGREYLHPVYRETYGSEDWSHPLLSPEEVRDFEALAADRFLVGSPKEVVEQVEALRDGAGVTYVGCRFHFPGMEQELVERQLELFGDEVIPMFD